MNADSSDPATILVVDDDRSMRELFSVLLQQAGMGVTCVASPEEARRSLGDRTPDLILLDVQLGGTDGIEFARELAVSPNARGIPIVIVSAEGSEALRERARGAGCTSILTKPIDPRTFGSEVLRFVPQKEARPSAARAQTGHQDAIFVEMRKQYVQEALLIIDELIARDDKGLLADGKLARAAHRWVGASSIDGLPNVEEIARSLEILAMNKTEQTGHVRETLSTIRSQFAQIVP